MFRQRQQQHMLPTTGGGPWQQRRSLWTRWHDAWNRTAGTDGSAHGIHVTPPIVQSWNRSSTTVRRTYQLSVVCLILLYIGYRTIRYQNSYIHVNCHSTACHVTIQPTGWVRKTQLTVARSQVIQSVPIKTEQDGTFVTDQGVSTVDYNSQRETQSNKKKKKKKKSKASSSYKGPDPDGYYISYQVILRDSHKITEPDENNNNDPDDGVHVAPVSLAPLLPFLQPTSDPGDYRLMLNQFRLVQSRRRVRSMTQKIAAYIKKRRQKLLCKENAPPSWQGIVLVVLGLIGFLLCILLGQIWSEDEEIARSRKGFQQRKQHLRVQQQRKARVQQQQQQQQPRPAFRYDTAAPAATRPRRQQVASQQYR